MTHQRSLKVRTNAAAVLMSIFNSQSANKKELVADLVRKAKQIEYLISSLPEPEPEDEQVTTLPC